MQGQMSDLVEFADRLTKRNSLEMSFGLDHGPGQRDAGVHAVLVVRISVRPTLDLEQSEYLR